VMSYIVVALNGSKTLVQPLDKDLVAITVSGPEAFIWPRVTVPSIVVPSSQCAPITRFVVGVCGRAGRARTVIMQSKIKKRQFFNLAPGTDLILAALRCVFSEFREGGARS
jgi:hypothetical protein